MDDRDIDRFWEKVEVKTENECWPWKASFGPNGYGQFHLDRKVTRSNRVACQIGHGEPPAGKNWALHECDNPACCNPKHLSWGDRADNMRQMSERGRSFYQSQPERVAKGARNGFSKLTESDIPIIREKARHGMTMTAIAQEFGVTRPTIGYIIKGATWAHV